MNFVNGSESETDLIAQAVAWLKSRLPEDWVIEKMADGPDASVTRLSLDGSGFMASIVVEALDSLTPREASNLLPGFGRALRSLSGGTALLVVVPWLSKRTREVLAEEGINYIDLTGNASVRLRSPAVYVRTTGAERNPAPKKQKGAQLRGPKAARVIRTLADVSPPYGVRELAAASNVTPGYVSRLLDTLYRESLVERSSRGAVISVVLSGLIRRWADSYEVFKTNGVSTFIAARGIDDLLTDIRNRSGTAPLPVITGSVAASRLAPVAAPASLIAYCEDPVGFSKFFELLPADEGANVLLLKPFDSVVWERTSEEAGLRFAAVPQVAVDCLTGNGRMPAEGEALLKWMQANESEWRLPSLVSLEEKRGDEHPSRQG